MTLAAGDRGASRVTQRNTATDQAEPAFMTRYGAALTALGHDAGAVGTSSPAPHEIGAATGIEFGPGKRLTVAAEPTRRGGGAATVVHAKTG